MELITYSFVLYLQHGRHDVKCKPSIKVNLLTVSKGNSFLALYYAFKATKLKFREGSSQHVSLQYSCKTITVKKGDISSSILEKK